MSNISTPLVLPVLGQLPRKRRILVVAGVVLLLVLLMALGMIASNMSTIPAGLDFGTTRISDRGLYRATITPAAEPIPVNQLHTWRLHVETADGTPITSAAITVDGDMPQHGHGMPTRPLVSANLGSGDYLVEGMKFQMGGWWLIDFDVSDGQESDRISFNLMLR
jgi:hypothetical protein